MKLVAELRAGVTKEVEVGRLKRNEQASMARLHISNAEFFLWNLMAYTGLLSDAFADGGQESPDRSGPAFSMSF